MAKAMRAPIKPAGNPRMAMWNSGSPQTADSPTPPVDATYRRLKSSGNLPAHRMDAPMMKPPRLPRKRLRAYFWFDTTFRVRFIRDHDRHWSSVEATQAPVPLSADSSRMNCSGGSGVTTTTLPAYLRTTVRALSVAKTLKLPRRELSYQPVNPNSPPLPKVRSAPRRAFGSRATDCNPSRDSFVSQNKR